MNQGISESKSPRNVTDFRDLIQMNKLYGIISKNNAVVILLVQLKIINIK